MRRARIAYLCEQIYRAQVPFRACHGVVRLKLAATQVFCELVVVKRPLQRVRVCDFRVRHDGRRLRLDLHILPEVEEGAEPEHAVAQLAAVVGKLAAGVEQIELHLEQVVLAYASHLALLLRHLI